MMASGNTAANIDLTNTTSYSEVNSTDISGPDPTPAYTEQSLFINSDDFGFYSNGRTTPTTAES